MLPPLINEKTEFKDLQLLLQLCTPLPSTANITTPQPQHDAHKWGRFVMLANRHGSLSRLLNALDEDKQHLIPDKTRKKLHWHHKQQSMRAMKLTRMLLSVVEIFAQNGLQSLSLKGPVLSQQLHNDPLYRRSMDLDFLIDGKDLLTVDRLLKANGFTRLHPKADLTDFQHKLFMERDNVASYARDSVLVEIHWRLFENPTYLHIPFEKVWQRRQTIHISEQPIPTLSNQDNLLYLVAHGAKHFWIYLKWMEDIVALSKIINIDEQKAAYTAAEENGLAHVMQSSLRFIHTFYGPDLSLSFSSTLQISRQHKRLEMAFSNSFCESSQIGQEISSRRANLNFFIRQYSLKSTCRYRLRLTLRWLINFEDVSEVPLPKALFPLYIILRPFLWLRRFLRDKKA